MYHKKLGLTIAYYRKMRGMTQENLGELIGIEQTHMSRIETANIGISLDLLFAIAEALEVPPYKLLEFKD